jgi:LCP family protein required for cell wall assembly
MKKIFLSKKRLIIAAAVIAALLLTAGGVYCAQTWSKITGSQMDLFNQTLSPVTATDTPEASSTADDRQSTAATGSATAEATPEPTPTPDPYTDLANQADQSIMKDTLNVLLIGVDYAEERVNNKKEYVGKDFNSDVMMVLRIDKDKKQLKLASFMRDTYVPIEGHNMNKLNTAYSFGRIDLAQKTFQQNFGITPNYYIIVNFYGMEDIINDRDGVEVNVKKGEELDWLNININEINKEDSKHQAKNITKAGDHHLDGRQAVAYMRIRHPDFDSGRIERQHTVLLQLFDKARKLSIGDMTNLISDMVNYVRTNIPLDKLIGIANTIKGMGGSELKTFRYPEEYDNPTTEAAGSIVLPKDFDTEMKKLKDFLEN